MFQRARDHAGPLGALSCSIRTSSRRGRWAAACPVIHRFAELTANVGVMDEGALPVRGRGEERDPPEADAAQGLRRTTRRSSSRTRSGHRADVEGAELDHRGPKYCGALPAGPYPVKLPLKATLQPNARLPQVELDGKIYDCFATDPSTKPRLSVTPKEAEDVLRLPSPRGTSRAVRRAGRADEARSPSDLVPSGDQCTDLEEGADLMAQAQYDKYRHNLQLALGLLGRATPSCSAWPPAGHDSAHLGTKLRAGRRPRRRRRRLRLLRRSRQGHRAIEGAPRQRHVRQAAPGSSTRPIRPRSTPRGPTRKMEIRLNSPLGLRTGRGRHHPLPQLVG